MNASEQSFPYFRAVSPRPLTSFERSLVALLVKGHAESLIAQVADLRVVGRCGCGTCPTVFFLDPTGQEPETDLSTMQGRDSQGGPVAAVLMKCGCQLSQLEFFSVDGHEPWSVPEIGTLCPL